MAEGEEERRQEEKKQEEKKQEKANKCVKYIFIRMSAKFILSSRLRHVRISGLEPQAREKEPP